MKVISIFQNISILKAISILKIKSRFWKENLDFVNLISILKKKISILKGKSRFWKNLDLVNKTRLSYLGHRKWSQNSPQIFPFGLRILSPFHPIYTNLTGSRMIMPIFIISYISKEFTNHGEHMHTNLEDSSGILGTQVFKCGESYNSK